MRRLSCACHTWEPRSWLFERRAAFGRARTRSTANRTALLWLGPRDRLSKLLVVHGDYPVWSECQTDRLCFAARRAHDGDGPTGLHFPSSGCRCGTRHTGQGLHTRPPQTINPEFALFHPFSIAVGHRERLHLAGSGHGGHCVRQHLPFIATDPFLRQSTRDSGAQAFVNRAARPRRSSDPERRSRGLDWSCLGWNGA